MPCDERRYWWFRSIAQWFVKQTSVSGQPRISTFSDRLINVLWSNLGNFGYNILMCHAITFRILFLLWPKIEIFSSLYHEKAFSHRVYARFIRKWKILHSLMSNFGLFLEKVPFLSKTFSEGVTQIFPSRNKSVHFLFPSHLMVGIQLRFSRRYPSKQDVHLSSFDRCARNMWSMARLQDLQSSGVAVCDKPRSKRLSNSSQVGEKCILLFQDKPWWIWSALVEKCKEILHRYEHFCWPYMTRYLVIKD